MDVDKGDDEQLNYRRRLVANDHRRNGDDTIFAPTPPPEALRTSLMMATAPNPWAPEWVRGIIPDQLRSNKGSSRFKKGVQLLEDFHSRTLPPWV